MNVDLSLEEIDYIIEMLEEAHKGLLHEIYHADSAAYKDKLRKVAGLNEVLTAKFKQPVS
ncbi:MAG: hypothetical protein MUQ56_12580 [Thermoleophilia bacterium]|jgi:hypothetical protein|nr:hypothetical protein [Thermoleophilia bacterium]